MNLESSEKMQNKTIAIVSNTSWFVYNFHLSLVKMLQEEGWRVEVLAPRDDYSQKLEEEGVAFHDVKINSKGTNPLEDMKLVAAFYRLYKALEPDVILHYTIKPNVYGSMAAGLLKIPAISSVTGLGTIFLSDNLASKAGKMLYKIALKVPEKVFYLNQADRDLFVDSGLVDAGKAELIPGSGIDTEKFKLRLSKNKRDTVRFLFIARLLRDKGIEEFVEAARQIGIQHSVPQGQELKIEFCILGAFYPGNPTAITEKEMQAWTEEGVISYLGTSDDVPSVIAKADCVVLPSYREGISQVLLEAASMVKPLIASDVPGCREVLEDGVNGFLCEAKNADDLAEQMMKMLALSQEEREWMGQEGRKKVQQEFDETVVNRKYLDTVEKILKSKKR
ncbi:glycosyltransferase family 4 protein [Sulfurovum sp. NBC37-1]|uniref:glycosyltransferase family 4 protein n=1 Tax=Sulfurovum sp. (strain NBC37-1) TaxID=387093 RepID=UPI0001587B1C|nr:glycosyltransferase family 4 protein [Sulfurovum sp. NBC37-1]BAF72467.1 glycosyl transferase [Sulfurovum sp. NBC37-1]